MNVRTRWLLYAALAVLPLIGGLAGVAWAGSQPPVYAAEARLAMGRGDAVDAAAQAQAANLARFLTSAEALRELPAGQVISVAASPIPESSVIRVEAKARDQANAVEAARVGAEQLQSKVAAATGRQKAAETLTQLRKLNRQVATYQSRVNASGGSGSDYVEAQTQLSSVTAQRDATTQIYQDRAKAAANTDLTLLAEAGPTGDNVKTRKQIALIAGFGGGALLAYVIARIVGDLTRRRPDDEPVPATPARAPKVVAAKDEPQPEPRKAPSRPPAHATPVRGAQPPPPAPRILDLPAEEEQDDETRLLAPVVPEQASAPEPEPAAVTGPIPRVRPAAGAGVRRGLNGLRQDTPAPRRTWP